MDSGQYFARFAFFLRPFRLGLIERTLTSLPVSFPFPPPSARGSEGPLAASHLLGLVSPRNPVLLSPSLPPPLCLRS